MFSFIDKSTFYQKFMLDCCTSDTIFMRPLCLQPAAVQICSYVLNGALLLEHNVAYYLERCSDQWDR